MKLLSGLILILCPCVAVQGQGTVDLEQFKHTDPDERLRIIESAPPAEQEALTKLDRHLLLVAQEGSEDNLKWAREKAVARARGFQKLENLFTDRRSIWEYHLHDVYADLNKQRQQQRPLSKEQEAMCVQLEQKLDAYHKVKREVHPLIYRLAFSPQAAKLEKQAEAIDANITARFASALPDTDKELTEIDRGVDAIATQLKQLPALPAEKVQAEYDQFPEGKLRTGGLNNFNN